MSAERRLYEKLGNMRRKLIKAGNEHDADTLMDAMNLIFWKCMTQACRDKMREELKVL